VKYLQSNDYDNIACEVIYVLFPTSFSLILKGQRGRRDITHESSYLRYVNRLRLPFVVGMATTTSHYYYAAKVYSTSVAIGKLVSFGNGGSNSNEIGDRCKINMIIIYLKYPILIIVFTNSSSRIRKIAIFFGHSRKASPGLGALKIGVCVCVCVLSYRIATLPTLLAVDRIVPKH
jgi:hypothetical protein